MELLSTGLLYILFRLTLVFSSHRHQNFKPWTISKQQNRYDCKLTLCYIPALENVVQADSRHRTLADEEAGSRSAGKIVLVTAVYLLAQTRPGFPRVRKTIIRGPVYRSTQTRKRFSQISNGGRGVSRPTGRLPTTGCRHQTVTDDSRHPRQVLSAWLVLSQPPPQVSVIARKPPCFSNQHTCRLLFAFVKIPIWYVVCQDTWNCWIFEQRKWEHHVTI